MLKCPKCVHLLALPLCMTNSSMTSCFFFFYIFSNSVVSRLRNQFFTTNKKFFFFKKKANNLLLNEFYFIVFNISPCNNQTFTQDNLHSTKKIMLNLEQHLVLILFFLHRFISFIMSH